MFLQNFLLTVILNKFQWQIFEIVDLSLSTQIYCLMSQSKMSLLYTRDPFYQLAGSNNQINQLKKYKIQKLVYALPLKKKKKKNHYLFV